MLILVFHLSAAAFEFHANVPACGRANGYLSPRADPSARLLLLRYDVAISYENCAICVAHRLR